MTEDNVITGVNWLQIFFSLANQEISPLVTMMSSITTFARFYRYLLHIVYLVCINAKTYITQSRALKQDCVMCCSNAVWIRDRDNCTFDWYPLKYESCQGQRGCTLHSSILQSKEGTNTAKMKGTKVLVTHIHMCNIIKIHVHCGYIRCMWYIYVASYIPTSRNQWIHGLALLVVFLENQDHILALCVTSTVSTVVETGRISSK